MIPNQWYPIFDSARLKSAPIGVKRLGRNIALWRADDGRAIAMRDRCPHRGAILSAGKIRDGCIECPYHGLRFDAAGKCVMIPANGGHAPVPRGFDTHPLAVREQHGLIWYWNGDEAPTAEVPWPDGMPEAGGGTVSYSYDAPVSALRLAENLLDVHHFHFLHRWSFPGVGPRVDDYDAHVDGETVIVKGTLRHERPGLLRRDVPFRATCKLPALAHIDIFGTSVNYAMTPIDEGHTWIWARYVVDGVPALLSRLAGPLLARWDRAVFRFQDLPVLGTQADPPGDFSRFKLYGADRGIALFFGMQKRAMLEASADRDSAAVPAARLRAV